MDVLDFDILKDPDPIEELVASMFTNARKEINDLGEGKGGIWNTEGIVLSNLWNVTDRGRLNQKTIQLAKQYALETANGVAEKGMGIADIKDITCYAEEGSTLVIDYQVFTSELIEGTIKI